MSSLKAPAFGPGSVEVGEENIVGGPRTRRLAFASKELVTRPFEGIDTVHDVLDYAARTHGTKNALGWRDVIDIHEEEKEVKKTIGGKEVTETKKWKFFQLSDYKYLTFVEVKDAVSEVARGLIELGITSDEIVNVYSTTR